MVAPWEPPRRRIIISTPPDLAPFRQKLKEGGLYKEWKEKMGPEGWALLQEISGPLA